MSEPTMYVEDPTIMTAERFMQLSDIVSNSSTPVKDYIWNIIGAVVVFIAEIALWYHWAGRVTSAMVVVNIFVALAIVIPYCRHAVWSANLWASGPCVTAWRELSKVKTVVMNDWPVTFEAFRRAGLYNPQRVNGDLLFTLDKTLREWRIVHEIDALGFLLKRATAIESSRAWPSRRRRSWIEDLLLEYKADNSMILAR